MSQQVTIKSVVGPGTPWSNDYGTFHPFTLTVDETSQPIEVNRKPDSPPLEAGQQVWVETKPGRDGALRGRIVQPPDAAPRTANGVQTLGGGGSLGDFRPGTQSAVKSAVAYAAAFTNPPSADDVILVAKQFFAAMEEMERGS